MPKTYPSGFRQRVLSLLAAGESVGDLARSLEVSEATLYRWRSQDQVDRGLKVGTSSGDHERLKAAHRRIGELEEELAATRFAAAMLRDEGIRPKGVSR